MTEIKITEVVVGNRARKGDGWLDSLERSIQQVGVLQPIGITPDKKLIFGGRRLQACKNLGLETIPARVFDIDADNPVTALRMEREENEHRKDLTPSEKVELGMRIEEALAGRRGSNQYQRKVGVATLPQAEPGTKTRDIAAEAVDMKPTTYRKAKAVVDSGDEEVIAEMDSGEKSINAAYKTVRKSKPKPTPTPRQTFKVTLRNNPRIDAGQLLKKGGQTYCTQLGIALLNAAGHEVEI